MKNLLLFVVFFMLTGGLLAQDITGTWNGVLEFSGVRLRLVLHISGENGLYQATLDSPDQGAKGIPATQVKYADRALEIEITSLRASYKGTFENDRIVGTFTQNNLPVPLNLGRGEVKLIRPQEPQPPFPYLTEEVVFENPDAGIRLAGTLTLPEKEGLFPAVVLISGSGPQNRDEEIAGHKPFWVLADYLTRRGIAVLRVDDRGVGASGGSLFGCTTSDFVTDVMAAVQYLKHRKEINPLGIGLIGHSEGGCIAPMVAAADPEIAFVVSLAGMGVQGQKLLLRQAADILRAMGSSESEITKKTALNGEAFRIVSQYPDSLAGRLIDSLFTQNISLLTDGKSTSPQQQKQLKQLMINQVMQPWMRYFIAFDPVPYWEKVKCPVLALNGEKDLQVEARENLEAIRRALEKGGNKQVKIVYLPGLNHLFQTSPKGLPSEYAFIQETFSPEALKMIADWVSGLKSGGKK